MCRLLRQATLPLSSLNSTDGPGAAVWCVFFSGNTGPEMEIIT